MTSEPLPPDVTPPRPVVEPANGLGIAGLVVSIVGLLTCGLLSPVGLVLSLVALRRPARGAAIAGTVIGAFGLLLGGAILLAFIVGFASPIRMPASPPAPAWPGPSAPRPLAVPEDPDSHPGGNLQALLARAVLAQARTLVEADRTEKGRLPEAAAGTDLIEPLRDVWGHALRYEPSGVDFTIRSAGADGEFDTPDDLTDPETPVRRTK